LDLVGTEARPVVLLRDDDGRLDIPHGLDAGEGVGILGDVDDLVGHAGLVQCALGGVALHAEGLGVHGDVQGMEPFTSVAPRGAMTVGGAECAECSWRPEGPVAALRSLRPGLHRWLPVRRRSPGCPVRYDTVNTTPSG